MDHDPELADRVYAIESVLLTVTRIIEQIVPGAFDPARQIFQRRLDELQIAKPLPNASGASPATLTVALRLLEKMPEKAQASAQSEE